MRNIIALIGVVILFAGCKELAEKGSIAGKVTQGKNGAGIEDIKVVALGDSLTPGKSIDPNSVRIDLSTDANGNYKIELVEPGDYFVIAWADSGEEWKYEDSLDAIGFYEGKISISKGEDKTGIDIDTLYVLP